MCYFSCTVWAAGGCRCQCVSQWERGDEGAYGGLLDGSLHIGSRESSMVLRCSPSKWKLPCRFDVTLVAAHARQRRFLPPSFDRGRKITRTTLRHPVIAPLLHTSLPSTALVTRPVCTTWPCLARRWRWSFLCDLFLMHLALHALQISRMGACI